MFHSILLAGDGSTHSLRACEKAVFLAKHSDESSITLLHVVDDLPNQADVIDEAMRSRDIPDHRKKRIAPLEAYMAKHEITFQTKHVFGDPGPTIVRHANVDKYDVVVIGSRGLNQFQQMVLGSVSHKVAKRANCPVLLVK
ncbi:universal stress protein [Paenalkalicoccus suaedae]|uniref:Universal stress protein n=1 Tax=Paenalkalicoccus suaedae TaxID=2592382 RepID=A0A859FGE2_9BACI|nr:universal stress protein [Paenalkalicoccus suaedae]QKS71296.1 universal stress protein [Paenalkalicoccus suaedae]